MMSVFETAKDRPFCPNIHVVLGGTVFGNLISTRIASTSSYHHFDALGSTRQLTNAAGTVTDTVIYDAWGNVVNRTGTTGISLLWLAELGYYYDAEAGLMYVRIRPYAPSAARWLTLDPLFGSESPQRYMYTSNAPILRVDPSGLQPSMSGTIAPVPGAVAPKPTDGCTPIAGGFASQTLVALSVSKLLNLPSLNGAGQKIEGPITLLFGNQILFDCSLSVMVSLSLCPCEDTTSVLYWRETRVMCQVSATQPAYVYTYTVPATNRFLGGLALRIPLIPSGQVSIANHYLQLATTGDCAGFVDDCVSADINISAFGLLNINRSTPLGSVMANASYGGNAFLQLVKCVSNPGSLCFGAAAGIGIGGLFTPKAVFGRQPPSITIGPFSYSVNAGIPSRTCITLP
jgi:RHS repeat-associated protein